MSSPFATPAPGADPWSAFALDPREPDHARLRAADRDRDVVSGWLGAAYSDGRLDRIEYDERSSAAVAAKTLGELPPLVVDLFPATAVTPNGARRIAGGDLVEASGADIETRARSAWAAHRRNAIIAFLGPSLICWYIYVSSFGGFPWPAIVSVATGLNLARVLNGRAEFVDEEVARLTERRRRQLKAPEQPMGND